MTLTIDSFTRINNDVNGNPRYVLHYSNFMLPTDAQYPADRYAVAVTRANKIGGRKYHTKRFGGGIVFQSYSLPELINSIDKLLTVTVTA